MGNAGLHVSWLVVLAACGRVGFDALGDVAPGDATQDGTTGDGPLTPICPSLAATCGSAGTSACCGTSLVPGGTVYRSYDRGTDNAWPDMSYPATVSDFRLDTYEVTVGRFRQFVDAGMGAPVDGGFTCVGARTLNGMPAQAGWEPTWNASLTTDSSALIASLKCNLQWNSWTDTPSANESIAMNCLTWFEAFAFCTWDGGFLPTEAEWNYAAVGGSDARAYPWSNPPSSINIDCSYTNYNNGTMNCVNPPNGAVNRVGSESPAGDSRWGHADLAGNVSEWTLDSAVPYSNPCNDCAQLMSGSDRTFDGGGYDNNAPALRAATRGTGVPTTRSTDIGVRCARS